MRDYILGHTNLIKGKVHKIANQRITQAGKGLL